MAPLRLLSKFIRDVPGGWFYLSFIIVLVQFAVDLFIKLSVLK